MAIKKSKPTSAGRRFYSSLVFDEVTKKTPEKSLLAVKKKHAGRNAQGKITVRHQGGGNRQKYHSEIARNATRIHPGKSCWN